MSEYESFDRARRRSLSLLARREHSRAELRGKLAARGFDTGTVERVLDALCAEGWLSDRRFAEQYVAARRGRGYGPVRIREELKLRGVDEEIRSACVDERDPVWQEGACRALARRFRSAGPAGPAERVKQVRFLTGRGYDDEQIRRALASAGRQHDPGGEQCGMPDGTPL